MSEIDGRRCPGPIVRLARAMREGDSARIHADDPAAAREIAALAAEHGWRLMACETCFEVEKVR